MKNVFAVIIVLTIIIFSFVYEGPFVKSSNGNDLIHLPDHRLQWEVWAIPERTIQMNFKDETGKERSIPAKVKYKQGIVFFEITNEDENKFGNPVAATSKIVLR